MEPWLEALVARGRQTGTLTSDEVSAAIPDGGRIDTEIVALLNRVLDRLDAEGITLIDTDGPGEEPPAPPPEPVLPNQTPEVEDDPVYRRDAAFEQRLREFGVPFSDAMVSHDPATGLVFDAELIVPGERALAAWFALRNAVPITGLWPVIQSELNEGTYNEAWPEQLDPGGRGREWFERFRRDHTIAPFRLGPETIRADAAANVAEAERVPPTPWGFRSRRRHDGPPPPIGEPDAPLPASEPDLAELFSNEGPFRCVRVSFGGNDWPFFPFLRVRLYPTAVPWEVFAYSPFGGWNDCPWPDEQLAMLRHWHERCGAEVVSVREDWYDLFVPHPPRTRPQAIELLRTHFGEERAFHVADGVDPVEALGRAHHWHFWWD
jgi:hypothetical protein